MPVKVTMRNAETVQYRLKWALKLKQDEKERLQYFPDYILVGYGIFLIKEFAVQVNIVILSD
jgi:hypothetical protein